MKKTLPYRPALQRPPLDQIRSQPWAFIGVALAAGMAAGLIFRVGVLRKALKAYLLARRYF
ncbi:MAG TPA: hypothetical protein VN673_16275 [Clostridia bacterium]|nr:hypothetical protein [Clostridia bacterium]